MESAKERSDALTHTMNYQELFLLGRVLYGGYFFIMGVNHFRNTGALAGYAASKGVPSPALAVRGSGLLLLLGGAGVLLGAHTGLAVLALALFLVPVTFKMHAFWSVADPNMKMMDYVNFMKNLALLGGALMLLMIPGPWPYSF